MVIFDAMEDKMAKRVSVSEDVYQRPSRSQEDKLDVLKEVGVDWQFIPGDDFKKGVSKKNFISRIRQYFIKHKMRADGLAFKYAWLEDGSCVVRTYEMSEHELEVYYQREERRLRTRAEKKLKADGVI